MNTIKYLKYKTTCPECGSKLYKNKKHEIYCIKCGLLVLDNYPNNKQYIHLAYLLGEKQFNQK